MKVITKMELQPDMVLGEDILDQNRVIYPAGTTVTPQIIEKLKRYDLVCVTIQEKLYLIVTFSFRNIFGIKAAGGQNQRPADSIMCKQHFPEFFI